MLQINLDNSSNIELSKLWLARDFWELEKSGKYIKAIEKEEITWEIIKIMNLFPSRIGSHLFRLYNRANQIENNFAKDFINLFENQQLQLDLQTKYYIGGEWIGVCMFRTHAPYIMKHLLECNQWKLSAMKNILKRGMGGQSWDDDIRDSTLSLAWLERFMYPSIDSKQIFYYILDENPNHISHKVADFFGKRIAELLLQQRG